MDCKLSGESSFCMYISASFYLQKMLSDSAMCSAKLDFLLAEQVDLELRVNKLFLIDYLSQCSGYVLEVQQYFFASVLRRKEAYPVIVDGWAQRCDGIEDQIDWQS
ncbi:hypothetical protein C5167_047235 [Papaver somniferum]|uniref:Uncharacterized protein n=1 Tax=Papaver somniferum TaxID=3469 RepID=A0A4Y7LHI8_PAPSO|nr:hypothetical protein C5167_047235 [Papaver somniferum]